MTTYHIEELFQEAEKLKATVTALEEKIKAMSEEKDDEIKPEYGDMYWVVNSRGVADNQMWTDHVYDETTLKNNAIFKKQEEAKFEAERLKVLRELEKLGREFKPHDNNYVIAFSHSAGLKVVGYVTTVTSYGNYYFDTEEEAKQAIEKIGEDRIRKYLFGIDLRGEPNE